MRKVLLAISLLASVSGSAHANKQDTLIADMLVKLTLLSTRLVVLEKEHRLLKEHVDRLQHHLDDSRHREHDLREVVQAIAIKNKALFPEHIEMETPSKIVRIIS